MENEGLLNRIKNTSKAIFLSLYDILQTQSDLRQLNVSRKRQRKEKQISATSLDIASAGIGLPSFQLMAIDDPTVLQPDISAHDSPLPSTMSPSTTTVAPAHNPTIAVATSSTTTATLKSTRRIVSNASIADPTQDSAGGSRVWASNEKASDIFANILIRHIVSSIWPDGITLDWVQGRNGDTKLIWSSKYIAPPPPPPPQKKIPSRLTI